MAETADTLASYEEKKVMLVALDDKEHSLYALQWTLDHFFSNGAALGHSYKLVVIHAKATASSIVGYVTPGTSGILSIAEACLKKISDQVIKKARELCAAKSVTNAGYILLEGDARFVLCNAVERFQADVLIVGSHGYGAVKRAMLGSVSDYCAHHAHCTVMIVKKPKHNP